jgi:hypothetical protein
MSLDANKRKVLADMQKLPLGEISKIAIREVIAAGAEAASKKEAAPAKKEEAKKEEAPAKKEEPAKKDK